MGGMPTCTGRWHGCQHARCYRGPQQSTGGRTAPQAGQGGSQAFTVLSTSQRQRLLGIATVWESIKQAARLKHSVCASNTQSPPSPPPGMRMAHAASLHARCSRSSRDLLLIPPDAVGMCWDPQLPGGSLPGSSVWRMRVTPRRCSCIAAPFSRPPHGSPHASLPPWTESRILQASATYYDCHTLVSSF